MGQDACKSQEWAGEKVFVERVHLQKTKCSRGLGEERGYFKSCGGRSRIKRKKRKVRGDTYIHNYPTRTLHVHRQNQIPVTCGNVGVGNLKQSGSSPEKEECCLSIDGIV